MSAPSEAHTIQLVKIQSEERLATTSELNLAPSSVTNCCGAKGMGYWAATQVKRLSPEITSVSAVDSFHVAEDSILITVGRRGGENPTGSESVARYQMDSMGTREAQSVLRRGVCNSKLINSELLQKALWESDQPIVLRKQGNACGGKGLTGEPMEQGDILHTQRWIKDVNKTVFITCPIDREVLLKSRMRENLKSGSVRGLIAVPDGNYSERRWL